MGRIIVPSARVISPARGLVLPAGMKGRASIMGDGVADYLTGVFPPALAGASPITMAGWFKPSGRGHASYRVPFAVGLTSGEKIAHIITTLSGGKWRWGCGTWTSAPAVAAFVVTDGEWVPVVLRHSGVAGTPMRLSVKGSTASVGTFTPDWTAGTVRLFTETGGTVYDWGGNAWDCRIYNRDWSDAEVAAFGQGERIDSTGLLRWWTCENPAYGTTCHEEIGNTDDAIVGALWSPDVPFRRRRVVEDVPACFRHNMTAYVVVSHDAALNPGAGPFGVMGWVQRRRSTGGRPIVISKGPAGATGWFLAEHETYQTPMFRCRDGAGSDQILDTVGQPLPLGEWYHVAASREAGAYGLAIRVNARCPITAASNDRNVGNEAALTIGGLDPIVANWVHQGDTSDLCYRVGSAWAPDEVDANYYDGIWPAGLTARWREREGAGTAVADDAGHASGPFHGTASASSWSTATRCRSRSAA